MDNKLIISLFVIFGIFSILGLVAFIKSFNSKNNFQAQSPESQSTSYCLPCVDSSGNSYTNAQGDTIACRTIEDWLKSENGGGKMGMTFTPDPNDSSKQILNVNGNSATSTRAENANKLLQNGATSQSGNYVSADKLNIGGTAAIATKSYNLTAEKPYDSYGLYGDGPNVTPNLSWNYSSFYNPNINDGTTYTTANLYYTNAQIKGHNTQPDTLSGNLIKSKYENS